MGTLGMAIIIIAILIIVFLITREFWCWYWKINEMKELLKSIDQNLEGNKAPEKGSKSDQRNEEKLIDNPGISIKEGYELIHKDKKVFAIVKGGNPDNCYCPYCYSQVNPNNESCFNCHKSFQLS